MKLSVFYWLCLPRQGYCVQIHYRVNSSLVDFGPLVVRSIFIPGFLKNDILACMET